ERAAEFGEELRALVAAAEAAFRALDEGKKEEPKEPKEGEEKRRWATKEKKEKPKKELMETKEKEAEELAEAIAKAALEAKTSSAACTAFLNRTADIKEAMSIVAKPGPIPTGVPGAETEMASLIPQLLQRLSSFASSRMDACSDSYVQAGNALREDAVRREKSRRTTEDLKLHFKKFDKDGDQLLSRSELAAAVKSEMRTANEEIVERVWKGAVNEGEKGLPFENMYLLRSSMGIVREMERNKKRKAAREARDKVLAGVRTKLKNKIKEVEKSALELDKMLAKIEATVAPLLTKVRSTPVDDMLCEADACEALISTGHRQSEAFSKKVLQLTSLDPKHQELEPLIAEDTKPLRMRAGRSKQRLSRAVNLTRTFRQKATKKQASAIEAVRVAFARK
ncbi:unnamed protein product, partial [Effrenium voratum]